MTLTKTFPKDTTGYYSFSVDSLSGVIVNVDEFDWAVPGNGILIWHIDENVINQKIADNKVNTNKHQRGVDVEEADGVQDIGEKFYTIFGDEVIGEGLQEDFWYGSNPSPLFQDLFDKNTRPDTRTNTGANSLITMKNFSEIANTMSFNIEFGDSVIKPIFTIEGIHPSIRAISLAASFNETKFNFTPSGILILFIYDTEGNVETVYNFTEYKTSSLIYEDTSYTLGAVGNNFTTLISDGGTVYNGVVYPGGSTFTPPTLRINSQNELEGVVGIRNGQIVILDLGSLPSSNPQIKEVFDFDPEIRIKQIAATSSYFSFIADSTTSSVNSPLFYDSENNSYSFGGEVPLALGLTMNSDGDYISVVLTDAERFYVISKGNLLNMFSLSGGNEISSFSLTDLKQDGTNYIIVNNGLNIEVYNLTGALADNFPFTDPLGIGFTGTPLAADFEGDSNSEIISVTKDGRIFAIDGGTGNVVADFPISCGSAVSVTPILYNANGKTNLAVLNDQSIFSGWSISSVEGKLYWSEEYGNPQNTSFIDAAVNTNRVNQFFPSSKAYNYPNPVYESTTNIRYYVSENASINIKIFDLAGDYVAELNDEAQGGM
ncbi:MAG: hypothetical protein ACHQ1D_11060, partial [Nitrososphaerales archaeon]